jgi:hypothetical protein
MIEAFKSDDCGSNVIHRIISYSIRLKKILNLIKLLTVKALLLQAKNLEKPVIDLIYDKQHEFTKEKGRKVSLEKTVERLLKEAYLSSKAQKSE